MLDLSQLVDYPWSQIAMCAKQAMISAALGGKTLTMPDGRVIGRISMEEAQNLYNFALAQCNAEESGPGGNTVLVRFDDPSAPRGRGRGFPGVGY